MSLRRDELLLVRFLNSLGGPALLIVIVWVLAGAIREALPVHRLEGAELTINQIDAEAARLIKERNVALPSPRGRGNALQRGEIVRCSLTL